jgi:undecaprenyl-phosphate galactose phosphotransferase
MVVSFVFSCRSIVFSEKRSSPLNLWQQNVLILGAGDAGMAVLKGLDREQTLVPGHRPSSTTILKKKKIVPHLHPAWRVPRLWFHANHQKIRPFYENLNIIIVALPLLSASELPESSVRFSNTISSHDRTEMKGIALLNTELCTLFMEQLFLIRVRNNLKSLYSRLIKRSFDCILTVSVPCRLPLRAVLCLALN